MPPTSPNQPSRLQNTRFLVFMAFLDGCNFPSGHVYERGCLCPGGSSPSWSALDLVCLVVVGTTAHRVAPQLWLQIELGPCFLSSGFIISHLVVVMTLSCSCSRIKKTLSNPGALSCSTADEFRWRHGLRGRVETIAHLSLPRLKDLSPSKEEILWGQPRQGRCGFPAAFWLGCYVLCFWV